MQAVILAGGQGSRLRPLTCDKPKPLVSLCSKPIIEYILDLLNLHHIDRTVITLGYEGNQIISHFETGRYQNIALTFSTEKVPLGTAGSVKLALTDPEEDYLVISGDALCDFDLTAALAHHKKTGAVATLIVKQVEDPREYGLVCTDQAGIITGFLEKPPLSRCVTNLANTGVYILSPRALDAVALGQKTDFASDVFPHLLETGQKMAAYEDQGYWCDIGDLTTYRRCQQDILAQKVRCTAPPSHPHQGGGTVLQPCFIGQGVTVAKGAVVQPGSVLCDRVTVEQNAKVKQSILLHGAFVGAGASCVQAIVGPGARMGSGSAIYEGGVLGAEAVLGDGAVVPDGLKVWNKKQVPANVRLQDNFQHGIAAGILCDEDGICGSINLSMTPELCCKIGAAVASLDPGGMIAIADDGSAAAAALKHSALSGILSTGADGWDFGTQFEARFRFCMDQSGSDYGLFLSTRQLLVLKPFGRGGLPLSRSEERQLESAVNRGEYHRSNRFGGIRHLHSFGEIYPHWLTQPAGGSLDGLSVQVRSANPMVQHALEAALRKLGCGLDGDLTLQLSSDGNVLSIHSPSDGWIPYEKLLLLLCADYLTTHPAISVPEDAPHLLEQLAKDHGATVVRYENCPCTDWTDSTRRLAGNTPFVRDGLYLAVGLLGLLKSQDMTLQQALQSLPDFGVASRFVPLNRSPGEIIRSLGAVGSAGIGGISIQTEQGSVRIRPIKSGKGLLVFAESFNEETAREMCDFYEHSFSLSPDEPAQSRPQN